MQTERRKFGDAGEDIAATYLEKKGYRIRDRQFLTRLGEIDLVAEDGNEIVFVEVKTRHDLTFGYPEESVTPAKLRKLGLTVELYLRAKGLMDADYRMDVIAILMEDGVPKIEHFEAVG